MKKNQKIIFKNFPLFFLFFTFITFSKEIQNLSQRNAKRLVNTTSNTDLMTTLPKAKSTKKNV